MADSQQASLATGLARFASVILLIGLALAIVACSGQPAGTESDRVRTLALSPNLSAFQKDILEDGELTFAEFEGAVLAFVSCLESKGYSASHVDIDEVEGFTLTVGWPDGVDSETSKEERDSCEFEYLWAVEQAFAMTRYANTSD